MTVDISAIGRTVLATVQAALPIGTKAAPATPAAGAPKQHRLQSASRSYSALDHRLMAAVVREDLSAVKTLLSQGANPHAGLHGRNALTLRGDLKNALDTAILARSTPSTLQSMRYQGVASLFRFSTWRSQMSRLTRALDKGDLQTATALYHQRVAGRHHDEVLEESVAAGRLDMVRAAMIFRPNTPVSPQVMHFLMEHGFHQQVGQILQNGASVDLAAACNRHGVPGITACMERGMVEMTHTYTRAILTSPTLHRYDKIALLLGAHAPNESFADARPRVSPLERGMAGNQADAVRVFMAEVLSSPHLTPADKVLILEGHHGGGNGCLYTGLASGSIDGSCAFAEGVLSSKLSQIDKWQLLAGRNPAGERGLKAALNGEKYDTMTAFAQTVGRYPMPRVELGWLTDPAPTHPEGPYFMPPVLVHPNLR